MLDTQRLLAVSRKEILQLRRDKRSLALAFVLPVLLVVIFAYGISWDVNEIRTLVVDGDGSAESRALVDAFRASGHFHVEAGADPRDVDRLIDRGRIQLAIVIPPDFSNDLGAGRTARLQAIVDGSDANTATIVIGYAQAIVQSYGRGVLEARGVDATGTVRLESRVWYNEELVSRNMIVPGLVAVVMMIIAAMLTSLTIAREWERGTMEQLVSTPVRRAEVVIGKLLPYVAIGVLDVVVTSAVGVLLFDVPFRGNVVFFMIASVLFLVGALGLGMFISAATRSQLLATQVAMVATFLPAFLLSGCMYSIAVMPRALQAVTLLIPARYFVEVTRGIFLKGVGPGSLAPQAVLMIAFATLGLVLSIHVFRKEIP